MCGRYSITTPVESMSRLFRFKGPMPNLRPRYNVAPTQHVPIVRRAGNDGARELVQVCWGLIPLWTKEPSIGSKMINARAEGIAEKPAFRAVLKARRCLVPADGFYIWQATPGRKGPWRATLKPDGLFAFAGLWERCGKAPDGVPVESRTIITTRAKARALSPATASAISALEVIVEPDRELGEKATRADVTALETLRRLRDRIDAETSDRQREAQPRRPRLLT